MNWVKIAKVDSSREWKFGDVRKGSRRGLCRGFEFGEVVGKIGTRIGDRDTYDRVFMSIFAILNFIMYFVIVSVNFDITLIAISPFSYIFYKLFCFSINCHNSFVTSSATLTIPLKLVSKNCIWLTKNPIGMDSISASPKKAIY